MREQLDPQKFLGMKTYERIARRVQIIQVLMEKFPREVYPAHDLIWYAAIDFSAADSSLGILSDPMTILRCFLVCPEQDSLQPYSQTSGP